MAAAVEAPVGRPAASWRRIAAIGVLLLAALAVYYVDRLPSAFAVGEDPWVVSRANSLALYGLPETQIFEFVGAAGAGLDVRAAVVRPSSQTIDAAVQGGVARPETKAVSLTWLGRVDPAGTIAVAISNQRRGGDAGVAILPTGTSDMPQVRFTALATSLVVTLQAVAGDSAHVPPILLKLGGATVAQPFATMMPVRFTLPPGESMLMTFADAASVNAASFRFGVPAANGELASRLPLDRFAIGRRAGGAQGAAPASVDRGVCSARAGAILFTHLRPRARDCGGGDLALETFDAHAGTLSVGVSGSGYQTRDGVTVAAGLFSAIANNKIIAALLSVAIGALVAWVWKTVVGSARS